MGPEIVGDLRPDHHYTLPDHLRTRLAQPFGSILKSTDLGDALSKDDQLISVGDIVSITLQEQGFTPKLFICDYRTQRGGLSEEYQRKLGQWGDQEIRVKNPPAQITRNAWEAVQQGLQNDGITRLVIDGEEDLLATPCMLEAQHGAKVLYGMPGRGIVLCDIDAALKETIRDLLGRFTHG